MFNIHTQWRESPIIKYKLPGILHYESFIFCFICLISKSSKRLVGNVNGLHVTDQETLRGNVLLIREMTHCFVLAPSLPWLQAWSQPLGLTPSFHTCVNNSITRNRGTIKALLHPLLDLMPRGELWGQRGAWLDPFCHCEALATLIPDPFYTPHVLCIYTDTQAVSDTVMACEHTLPPPPSFPSSRQRHGIVSHVSASSCVTGVMLGTRSAKQWGEVSMRESKGGVCGHRAMLPVSLHDGSHLPTASHVRGNERQWHFALLTCPSPSHLIAYTEDETKLTTSAEHVWLPL